MKWTCAQKENPARTNSKYAKEKHLHIVWRTGIFILEIRQIVNVHSRVSIYREAFLSQKGGDMAGAAKIKALYRKSAISVMNGECKMRKTPFPSPASITTL